MKEKPASQWFGRISRDWNNPENWTLVDSTDVTLHGELTHDVRIIIRSNEEAEYK